MSATLLAPRQFFPSPYTFRTSVAPLTVYPPQGPYFGFHYGMVDHTPPASLFAVGPSRSGARDDGKEEDDTYVDEEEEDDDDAESIQRNPQRNCRPPRCGTEGHIRH
ncbi:hypothetical protein V6N13_071731 [Hibiscus sabdariffa]